MDMNDESMKEKWQEKHQTPMEEPELQLYKKLRKKISDVTKRTKQMEKDGTLKHHKKKYHANEWLKIEQGLMTFVGSYDEQNDDAVLISTLNTVREDLVQNRIIGKLVDKINGTLRVMIDTRIKFFKDTLPADWLRNWKTREEERRRGGEESPEAEEAAMKRELHSINMLPIVHPDISRYPPQKPARDFGEWKEWARRAQAGARV